MPRKRKSAMPVVDEPLVEPGADLRDLPGAVLDARWILESDLAYEDPETFVVSFLAWCAAWRCVPAGSLPDDDRKLARMLGYGTDFNTWKAVRARCGLHGWVRCSKDGLLYHPILATKVAEALAKVRKPSGQTQTRVLDVSSSEWRRLRAAVLQRDNFTCRYCNTPAQELHCEHVIPFSRGGKSVISNLVASCRDCNLAKGTMMPPGDIQ